MMFDLARCLSLAHLLDRRPEERCSVPMSYEERAPDRTRCDYLFYQEPARLRAIYADLARLFCPGDLICIANRMYRVDHALESTWGLFSRWERQGLENGLNQCPRL